VKIRILLLLVTLSMLASGMVLAQTKDHIVSGGDTLSGIAAKYFGDARLWPELLKYNSIADPHWIYTGDVIKIPTEDVLNNIKDAKTEEEKQEIINKSKYGQYTPPPTPSADSSSAGTSDGSSSSSNEIRLPPADNTGDKPVFVYRVSDIHSVLQKYAIRDTVKRPKVK
jgi:LysM repeat protein